MKKLKAMEKYVVLASNKTRSGLEEEIQKLNRAFITAAFIEAEQLGNWILLCSSTCFTGEPGGFRPGSEFWLRHLSVV